MSTVPLENLYKPPRDSQAVSPPLWLTERVQGEKWGFTAHNPSLCWAATTPAETRNKIQDPCRRDREQDTGSVPLTFENIPRQKSILTTCTDGKSGQREFGDLAGKPRRTAGRRRGTKRRLRNLSPRASAIAFGTSRSPVSRLGFTWPRTSNSPTILLPGPPLPFSYFFPPGLSSMGPLLCLLCLQLAQLALETSLA